jgi:hypothetical protein
MLHTLCLKTILKYKFLKHVHASMLFWSQIIFVLNNKIEDTESNHIHQMLTFLEIKQIKKKKKKKNLSVKQSIDIAYHTFPYKTE